MRVHAINIQCEEQKVPNHQEVEIDVEYVYDSCYSQYLGSLASDERACINNSRGEQQQEAGFLQRTRSLEIVAEPSAFESVNFIKRPEVLMSRKKARETNFKNFEQFAIGSDKSDDRREDKVL